MPPQLKALILEVLEEVLGGEEAAGKVKANAFIGISPEAYTWGSLDTGFQMMLPGTIMHRSQKEFNLSEYQFGGRTPESHKLSSQQMESDDVAVFKQSVLLTENAKKFVIARELERIKAGSIFGHLLKWFGATKPHHDNVTAGFFWGQKSAF